MTRRRCWFADSSHCPDPVYRHGWCLVHWAWFCTQRPGLGPVEHDETGFVPGRKWAALRYAELLEMRQQILEAAGLDWDGKPLVGPSRL